MVEIAAEMVELISIYNKYKSGASFNTLVTFLMCLFSSLVFGVEYCTYNSYEWDTKNEVSVNQQTIILSNVNARVDLVSRFRIFSRLRIKTQARKINFLDK
ncbi:MAG: hypothetical protein ACI9LM_005597 [Alteromonadaceae bacterium]